MNFHNGDTVMHWAHGLGKVIRLESLTLSGENILHYAIQIGDITVWVPSDEKLKSRLRFPTDAAKFKRLMDILSHPGEPLPANSYERKKLLWEWLKDGRVETLFRVICGLTSHRHFHPLNEDDQIFLKRSRSALLGEWSFTMDISLEQAEHELHHLLASHSSRKEEHPEELEVEKQRT